MGQGTSKLRDDAGLADSTTTVDGASPTSEGGTYAVSRGKDVVDYRLSKAGGADSAVEISSSAFGDLPSGFDVMSVHNTSTPDIYASVTQNDGLMDDGTPTLVARVAADESHRKWTVYWVDKPTYSSQADDPEASKASGSKLYRKCEIQVSDGRYSAVVKRYEAHSNPKEDVGVLSPDVLLKLEKPIGMSELVATHYYTLLDGETSETSSPIAAWQWAHPFANKMEFAITKGADLTLHFILLVVMNIVQKDKMLGVTQSGDVV
jgi:hypothetical protein